MKILFVITKGNWGGAQKYVFELATHVPKPAFEVKVVCGQGDTLPEKLKAVSIPVVQLPNLGRDINIFKDISSFFSLISLFKKERPDIVHLNSSKIGGIGALAARIAGVKKIIFTVHGFAFNENRPWIERKIIAFISWLSIVFCTDVIFTSEKERAIASSWPGVTSKTHLIYNGIESPTFLPRENAQAILAQAINQPISVFEGKTIVGSIGELTKNKGYPFALEAIRDIPNSIYIIIGQGEEAQHLKALCQEKNLYDKVFFAGFIKDASTLLKGFDIFLLPSLKEGIPYVILEAGAAMVPVISTDVGGISELIIHQQTGILIKAADPIAIKNALLHGKQYRNTLNDYAARLYKGVTTNFSLKNMVDKTVALYSNNTI